MRFAARDSKVVAAGPVPSNLVCKVVDAFGIGVVSELEYGFMASQLTRASRVLRTVNWIPRQQSTSELPNSQAKVQQVRLELRAAHQILGLLL